MIKIIIGSLAVVLLSLVGWFGYNQFFLNNLEQESNQLKNISSEKVTMGATLWPGYIALYIAQDKGYFKELGLNFEIKTYPSLKEASQDYLAGTIQAKANISLDALDEAYQGLDHKIVLVTDFSNGADGILARDPIKNIAQIKGKKVAFEHGTIEEFFLRYALKQHNLSINDITPVNLDAEKSAKALVDSEVDVAVTYEPFLTASKNKVNANLIFSSKNAPGLITDIITFRTDFIKKNPEWIEAFVKAYFKGFEFYQNNPEEAHSILARELGVTPKEAEAQLQGLALKDLRDNKATFTFGPGLQSLYGNLRQSAESITEQRGANTSRLDTDKLVEPKFINNLFLVSGTHN